MLDLLRKAKPSSAWCRRVKVEAMTARFDFFFGLNALGKPFVFFRKLGFGLLFALIQREEPLLLHALLPTSA